MVKPEGPTPSPTAAGPHYGRYVGLLAVVILVLITINTVLTKPNGVTGLQPGERLRPFAVPLVTGNLPGDANVATEANEGGAGKVPACSVRGPEVLNICQLYEQGPVVLALFVDGASCARVLEQMQALSGSFPQVRFAAVSIEGNRGTLRRLVRSRHLSFPVGIDSDGALAALYKLATCPQVTFALRGGVVASRALLNDPSVATLRRRITALVAARTPAG